MYNQNLRNSSGLFVVVSWISFVVPPDVIPGRMALLITLFLVLVNIFNSVTTNTPKAEGERELGLNIRVLGKGGYNSSQRIIELPISHFHTA